MWVSRDAESESDSELESVRVDSSSWSRSRSHQNLTDSDCGVGVATWLNVMHCTCLIDDTVLDIRFCRKKVILLFWTNVLSERNTRRWIPQNMLLF